MALDDLPTHLLLLTTLRILTLQENANFTAARSLPIRILSEILSRYVQLIGNQAKQHAEESGRTHCNLPDVVTSLANLGVDAETIEDWLVEAKRSTMVTDGEGAGELSEMAKQLIGESLRWHSCLRGSCAMLLAAPSDPPDTVTYSYRPRSAVELEQIEAEIAAASTSDVLMPAVKIPSSPTASHDSDVSSDADGMDLDVKVTKPVEPLPEQAAIIEVEESDPEEEDTTPESLWQSLDDIPDHIPFFLPPLPGFEKARAHRLPEPTSRRANPLGTSKRIQPDPLHRPDLTAHLTGAHVDPWRHEIPYDRSSISEAIIGGYASSALPSLSPPPSPGGKPKKTSLPSYYQAYRELANQNHQPGLPMRTAKGKKAAGYLSQMTYTGADSLFGNMRPTRPNFQRKTPGWLPYPLRLAPSDPDPTFHPFDLKSSLIEPISFPVRSAEALVPIPHGRTSTIYSSLTRPLSKISSPRLFNRTTRIGQPAPLGPNGESWPYALAADESLFDPTNINQVQMARKVQPGFRVREKDWRDEKLPNAKGAKVYKAEGDQVIEEVVEEDKEKEVRERTGTPMQNGERASQPPLDQRQPPQDSRQSLQPMEFRQSQPPAEFRSSQQPDLRQSQQPEPVKTGFKLRLGSISMPKQEPPDTPANGMFPLPDFPTLDQPPPANDFPQLDQSQDNGFPILDQPQSATDFPQLDFPQLDQPDGYQANGFLPMSDFANGQEGAPWLRQPEQPILGSTTSTAPWLATSVSGGPSQGGM